MTVDAAREGRKDAGSTPATSTMITHSSTSPKKLPQVLTLLKNITLSLAPPKSQTRKISVSL